MTDAYFDGHMKWFKDNIENLISSLKFLATDSEQWSKEGLEQATIFGPFGYGFSFGGKWYGQWENDVKNQIPAAIKALIRDLETLKSVLEKHCKTSRSIWTSGTGNEVPVPQNLKEAIDWVLRISGGDGVVDDKAVVQDLANEVKKLLQPVDVGDFKNDEFKIKSLITTFAAGLKSFIGYNGGRNPGGKSGIASNHYRSSYEVSDTWEPSWNSASDANVQKCANIFLGIAPLLYYGMTYLYPRYVDLNGCNGNWEAMGFNDGDMVLNNFMVNVGYSDKRQLSSREGKNVMSKTAETFTELQPDSVGGLNSSFSAYLQGVQQKGKATLNSTPETCPMYSLHHVAKAFWESAPAKTSGISDSI
ncbi:variant erythrocyte surface antigen-1 family protein [Babesia caballi]|uniref:Variant erythrocyte surface antigen-1 family protein n=1 Tax=Babesia caballi TaxID=5871 RepID=A0AAV4LSC0_BABCB|nr:variant erythrocyte surface antigen-1 family protein [Babesia caballi]